MYERWHAMCEVLPCPCRIEAFGRGRGRVAIKEKGEFH